MCISRTEVRYSPRFAEIVTSFKLNYLKEKKNKNCALASPLREKRKENNEKTKLLKNHFTHFQTSEVSSEEQ